MVTAVAYLGVSVDHLYLTCPGLAKAFGQPRCCERHPFSIGDKAIGTVDPLGPDICGWCRRVWLARHP